MALRSSRLLTSVVASGLVAGSLLLGAGSALAAPSPAAPTADDVVQARCGQTVRAEPGQTVRVVPDLGLPFEREVRAGMDPIAQVIGGVLCRVQVQVVEPVAEQVAQAAPPLRQATDTVRQGSGAVLAPSSRAQATPRQAAPAVPPAAAPAFTPEQAAAAAPAFGPAFGALPASFLRSASGPAPGVRAFDPNLLMGSAFPGLRAGSPAYLGYDPASAVTTASQVQALPVDGLTGGGVGVPALIAVLALSGVAAFAVRRMVLGRAPLGAGAAPSVAAAPVEDDEEPAALEGADLDAELEDLDELDELDDDVDAPATAAVDGSIAVGRAPVPA